MTKKKILVVDDEVPVTKLLKLILERSGRYEIRCENAGAQAVSAAKSYRPDLVLLDVNLPDMEGGEISAAFQEDPVLKDIPIIFLTGLVSAEEMKSGLTIRGRPALAKPIDAGRLIDCVEKNLPAG